MLDFKRLRFWIGILISLLFLVILVWSIDIRYTLSELKSANYIYVIPAIALYFVSVYFRSIRWKLLLSHMKDIPVNRLYPIVVIGYMANNLLPVRLGELVRAYYLARRESINGASSLASIAVERVYDGLTLLCFCVISIPFLISLGAFKAINSSSNTHAVIFAFIAISMFVGALLTLTFMSSSKFIQFRIALIKLFPDTIQSKINSILGQFLEGLASLKTIRTQSTILMFSIPVWLSECGVYLLVGYSFEIHTYFASPIIFILAIILVTATSNLITAIPSSVGGIGPFEVAAQQTLVVLGLNSSLAAAYSGFIHIIALWLPVNLLGILFLWKHNMSMKTLVDMTTPQSEPSEPYNNTYSDEEMRDKTCK